MSATASSSTSRVRVWLRRVVIALGGFVLLAVLAAAYVMTQVLPVLKVEWVIDAHAAALEDLAVRLEAGERRDTSDRELAKTLGDMSDAAMAKQARLEENLSTEDIKALASYRQQRLRSVFARVIEIPLDDGICLRVSAQNSRYLREIILNNQGNAQ